MPESTWRGSSAGAHKSLQSLASALEQLRASCLDAENEFRGELAAVRPMHRAGSRNLVHYVAMRRFDLRVIQAELARLGLSSLGRSEAHVIGSLDTVIGVLRRLNHLDSPPEMAEPVESFSECLERNADRLLGPLTRDCWTRVMVTLPSEAADHPELVSEFMNAGMDIARINCAHDSPQAWRSMAEHVRAAAAADGRACRIAMDLAGPKLRTGAMPLGPPVVRIAPNRDRLGVVLAPARVWLRDDDTDGPVSADATDIPVGPAGVLSRCRTGDVIRLRDARNAKRRLRVVDLQTDRVLVEAWKTTYLETAIELQLPHTRRKARATIGVLPRREVPLLLHVDDELTLTRTDARPYLATAGALRVSCTLPEVLDHARLGHRVWFDDGKIGAVVIEAGADELKLRIVDARPGGARLRGAKGINLPDTELPIPAMTAQDEADLAIAVTVADMINVSFVRSVADVTRVQKSVAALGAEHVGLIFKIETVAGFERLPAVLLAAMRSERVGVMIARGDLAVEVGYERMAEVQEEILWLCEAASVPVVWATQVLDQLARTGRPSRAEVTDAGFAARAECVMLNKGPHVAAAIATVRDIDRRMHDHHHKKQSLLRRLRAWDHEIESGTQTGT